MKLKINQIKREDTTQVRAYNLTCKQVSAGPRLNVCGKVESPVMDEVWDEVWHKIRITTNHYEIFEKAIK